ncbi:MAG: T9SS type A sorting domain-containing protein [Saprospiraceae bacterium]|nr:T9SS type A sorting domain-containing protein [Saprospiraceae bacterium]
MNPGNLLIFLLSLLSSVPLFSQQPPRVRCFDNIRVSVAGNLSSITNCTADGQSDRYRFDINTKAMPFAYIITDINDTILLTTYNRNIDFEQFGEGVFKVYSVSFLGELDKSEGYHLDDAPLGSVCHSVSQNHIPVYNIVPDGKTIASDEGLTTVYTCPGDGQSDIVGFVQTSTDPFYTFVLTDPDNVILGYADANNAFDFETVGQANCRVWGLSYLGDLNQPVGVSLDEAVFSDLCFDLSDNFVDVIQAVPDGGSVQLADGNTTTILCGNDGMPDTLELRYQSSSPVPYTFVLASEAGTVLQLISGNAVALEGLSFGAVYIYGISYTGNLSVEPGQTLSGVLSTDCYEVSAQPIEIRLSDAEGGSLTFADGSLEQQICASDPGTLSLDITLSNTRGDAYVFVVTDISNTVLLVQSETTFDLQALTNQQLRIWGLAYSGNLLLQSGDQLPGTALSDLCYDLSDNFLVLEAQNPVGGSIRLADGATTTSVCTGDEFEDLISAFTDGSSGFNYNYVLTDTNDILISDLLFDATNIAVENTPGTVVRVHGLSWFSTPEPVIGSAVGTLAQTECNDLSDNFITVTKIFVDGGTLSVDSGTSQTLVCSNDPTRPVLRFSHNSGANLDYRYLLSDANNVLIALLSGDSLSTEQLAAGNYRVWGLSYSGDLLVQPGDQVSEVALSNGCYELSDNAHPIAIEGIDGGQISYAGSQEPIFVCAADIFADFLTFSHTGSPLAAYGLVLTDESGEILEFTESTEAEFNNLPSRIVRVWGVSYTGNLTLEIGDTLGQNPVSDRCYDLSEQFVEVIRELPEAGSIAFADGTTSFLICPDAPLQEVVLDSMGTSSGPYAYILTDSADRVLAVQPAGEVLDLGSFTNGNFRIRGLAYTGILLAEPGDLLLGTELSNDCYELSGNFLSIFRQQPPAHDIASNYGLSSSICPDDQPNIIRLSSNQMTPADYRYLITTAAGDRIVALPEADTFDLNTLTPGDYLIRGLAYSGDLQLSVDSILAVQLAAQPEVCYTLSGNAVTVEVYIPESGEIFVNPPLNADNLSFCTGDGIPDTVVFNAAFNSGGPNAKLVTDTNNVLIRIETEATIDFDSYPSAFMRVWRVFYTGQLTVVPGDTITAQALSTECYDLSDNFIAVQTSEIDGGAISSPAISVGNTLYLCDDGQPKEIAFSNDSEAGSSDYVYVITNQSNLILRIFADSTHDVSTLGFKKLRVYGLSYSGALLAAPGRNILSTELAEGCYALSENALDIFIDDVAGGNVTTTAGQTSVLLCMTPEEGILDFSTSSLSDVGYLYILTNPSNTVLALYQTATIDFGDLPVGNYRVWGLSYSGQLADDVLGQDATALTWTNACFALSENFVAVDRRANIDGGMLIPVQHDSDVYYTCTDSDRSTLVAWENQTTDPNYRNVITDENNVIRFPFVSGNIVDFASAPAGIYRVWGISYSGAVTLTTGTDLDNLLGTGCWQFSANYLTIYNDTPDGASIFAAGAQNNQIPIIAGNGISDSIVFSHNSSSLSKYIYLVIDQATDTLVATFTAGVYDFDDTGSATLLVRGLSYTGNLSIGIGDVVGENFLSDDCYDLSDNAIQIIKTDPNLRGGDIPSVQLLPRGIREIALAPNPVSTWLVVSFYTELTQPANGKITLYHANGNPARTTTIALMPGLNTYNIGVHDLERGVYYMKIMAKGRIPQTVPFVVQ